MSPLYMEIHIKETTDICKGLKGKDMERSHHVNLHRNLFPKVEILLQI